MGMGMGQAGIIACMYRILNIWFGWYKLNISHAWNGGSRLKKNAQSDTDQQKHAPINIFLAE